ncbi:hypothetical protein QTO34_015938 [Cnephaeus nilssonii]|uniref:Reelin domain-containing protein n=1 Tax=Cnephaeus nilssonii TaxID=3371016 RepID=A0AA40I502_CNENI|nr:hypothetical protein QTO34_015938 [Eptesicus nilssonii]
MRVAAAHTGWVCAALGPASCSSAFSHGASTCRPSRGTPGPTTSPSTPAGLPMLRDTVPVTVRSSGDFMGFLPPARRASDHQAAGTFLLVPPHSRRRSCFEEADTVTHADKSPRRSLAFVWKAPAQPVGGVRFLLSVVQSYLFTGRGSSHRLCLSRRAAEPLPMAVRSPAPCCPHWGGGRRMRKGLPQSPRSSLAAAHRYLAVALAGAAEEDSLDPVPASTGVSEFPGDAEAVFQPPSHTATTDSHGQPARRDSNPTLEPSLDVCRLERLVALRRLSTEGFASSPSAHHRTQDDPSFDLSETCLSSDRNEQDKVEASNRTVMRHPLDTNRPTYPQRLWPSGTLAGAGAGAGLAAGAANPTLVFHTSASPGPLTAAGQSEAAGASASFLPRSKHEELERGREMERAAWATPGRPTQGPRLGKREPMPLGDPAQDSPTGNPALPFGHLGHGFGCWPLHCTPSIATSGQGCPSGSLQGCGCQD